MAVEPLAGATAVGYISGGPLPAPTPWTSFGSWISYGGGVVVGTPTGGNLGPGSLNANSLFVNGAPFNLSQYLPLTGGAISGPLILNGAVTFGSTVDGLDIDLGVF